MKYLTSLLFGIAFCFLGGLSLQAQEENNNTRSNALYFEGFGNSLYYGLHYDSRFFKSDKGLGGSLGIGAYRMLRNEIIYDYQDGYEVITPATTLSNYFGLTAMVNYLWGKGPHNLEAGAGVMLFSARNFGYGFVMGKKEQFTSVFGTFSMMYRLHLPKSLFLRVGWAPFMGMATDGNFVFIPYQFGLGLGYAFQ